MFHSCPTGLRKRIQVSMNTFLLTMQYDERLCLPVFMRHYSRYFRNEQIFIIDHGSESDLTPPGCNRLFVPRDRPFSEKSRMRLIRSVATGLLEFFDAGVFADCDELINLDALGEFCAHDTLVRYVAGFDVFAGETSTGTRLLGYLAPQSCKASVFKRTPEWALGFHGCEHPPGTLTMPMAHIRFMFQEQSAQRLRDRISVRRTMAIDEASEGIAAQWADGDAEFRSFYQFMSALGRRQTKILRFSSIDAGPMFQRSLVAAGGDRSQVMYRPNGYTPAPDVLFDLTEYFPGLLQECHLTR